MTLHYTESGNLNADPIIYLHGAGMAGWTWHDVTSMLPQYHNIMVDLPGHGDSHTVQIQTLTDMANYVADFIVDMIPHGKAHLVGISLGGMTTVEMLQHRPEVIISAVISGVNAIPLPLKAKLMTQMMMPFIKTNFLIRQNAKMFQFDKEASEAYFRSMKQFDVRTFKNILSEVVNFAPVQHLQGLDTSTLFVAGSNEESINVESVALMANAMTNAVGVLAPNLHHGWSGENPKLFADMIHQWVSAQEVATGLELVADKRQELALA